jgi:GNAT superfamily N-acetyltransferase
VTRRFRALTADRLGDLPDSCAGCSFWETDDSLPPDCGSTCDSDRQAEWIRTVISEWGDCGRIAYIDGDALGFVKYAPPRYFPQVRHMAVGTPSDDAVLLACLHVASDARHAGLGKVMLQAALRDLVARGERALEAYGAIDPVDRRHTPMITVEFLLRQGFTVVRPNPRYPLLRLELRTLAAWTESVEAVLESIQIPLRVRERVPAPTGADGLRKGDRAWRTAR